MSGEPPRPGAVPGWGQTPTEPPATPDGSPEPAPSAAPGWGTPPPPPAPVTPPPQPGWGPPSTAPGSASGPPPGPWNPAPPPATGGCLKAFLVVAGIAFIGFVVLALALVFLGNRMLDEFGGLGGGDCPILSQDAARAALGPDTEVLELTGISEATLGLVLDKRVLPDAEDCWITSDDSEALGRVARYRGSDAAARFQTERQNAEPRSEDRGGGVSVEFDGYFGGEVGGLGDEAFCTGVSPAIQAGVLVRRGDTLVYASLSAVEGTNPDYGTSPEGVAISPATCTKAQGLARAMLP